MILRSRTAFLLVGIAWCLSTPGASAQGTTTRVSVSSAGVQGDSNSYQAQISADGEVVAFASVAANLVPPTTGARQDIFAHVLASHTTERVSYGTSWYVGPISDLPVVSGDGRYVLYTSLNHDIYGDSIDDAFDAFVKDRQTGVTVQISPNTYEDDYGQALTDDGRYALYTSYLSGGTLVRRDLVTNQELLSTVGTFDYTTGGISADGDLVALSTAFTSLVPDDTNGKSDVFVRSLSTGTTTRVSVATDGTEGDGDSIVGYVSRSISPDGRYVVFSSLATNLVPGDANGVQDVFLRDRQLGRTELVSVASGGTQGNGASKDAGVSADGRFIVFESTASDLVPGDTNGVEDVFLRDRLLGTTVRVSVSTSGAQANGDSYGASISADGRRIAFISEAYNLVPSDRNDAQDVFVREMPPEPILASFCPGDLSNPALRSCPCANSGATTRGCANSVGTGALLSVGGTTLPDTLVLSTDGMLPHVLNIYLQSDGSRLPGVAMGDGVRCLAGTIRRLAAKIASNGGSQFPESGDPSISARSAALGDPLGSGKTRYYQTYYRDNSASFCPPPVGGGANVSSAVRILW